MHRHRNISGVFFRGVIGLPSFLQRWFLTFTAGAVFVFTATTWTAVGLAVMVAAAIDSARSSFYLVWLKRRRLAINPRSEFIVSHRPPVLRGGDKLMCLFFGACLLPFFFFFAVPKLADAMVSSAIASGEMPGAFVRVFSRATSSFQTCLDRSEIVAVIQKRQLSLLENMNMMFILVIVPIATFFSSYANLFNHQDQIIRLVRQSHFETAIFFLYILLIAIGVFALGWRTPPCTEYSSELTFDQARNFTFDFSIYSFGIASFSQLLFYLLDQLRVSAEFE